jgi:hypothetical protein
MRRIFPYRTGFFIAAAAMAGMLLGLDCVAPLGGGSEAGNARITGKVVDTQGSPVGNALVTIRPSGFDPVKNAEVPNASIDTTGSDGIYRVWVRKGIAYTVEALLPVPGTRALVAGVAAKEAEDEAPQCTVKIPGAIKVKIPDSADNAFGYMFIPGTSRFTMLNNAGDFVVLYPVPAGTIPAVYYSSKKIPVSSVIRYNVPMEPGDTTVIYHPSWKYSRQLVLNTSPSGANVPGDVFDFPVLIRLNAGNSDFSLSQTAGADIRFTKMDNMALPYEIERWDAAAGRGEVWVTVDTVRGNNSNQTIVMYWGNSTALDFSNGAEVFDTAKGFAGVWHLSDGVDEPVRDATVNGNHGMSPDTARPEVAAGAIGNGRVFDGNRTYITMPNTATGRLDFPQNGQYSVSAWVMADTFDGLSHVIVSKGNMQYFLWFTPIHLSATLWEFAEYRNGSGWDLSVQPSNVRQWVLLTGVRDGPSQRLYVTGEPADTLIDFPFTAARNSSTDLIIGRFNDRMASPNDLEGYCPFRGSIDEVRISGTARSPGWIKLCYMNQRTDDRLVIFK